MIALENVSAGFGAVQVLHDLTLSVGAGRLAAVVGANGAGKTTLLRTISNIVRPSSGTISFEGRPTAGVEPHHIARAGLIHVPQGRQIIPTLSVRDNLLIGAQRIANLGHAEIEAGVDREFERFPVLRERQDLLGGNLSGGEQQMLAVSRALMMKPKLLMLDEPSLGLAPQIVRLILDTLRRLAEDGLAILLVEQLAHLALEVADEAHILQRGRIVLSGPASKLRSDNTVIGSYLT
ncbi:MAG: ABC transporter ATP-binding protein [Hyphomicrobium sp.]|nr:ABC transporter ATP-binding protein [Hyphomicrobium sp.]